ncbi:MAG: (d)CMP kinase [Candidatus Euphemobacter frigidus]|nr:(d)CMP kinase [Candidatus Euphemobacter frigidus]MDP8276579.1 (d)CMP kinase [Candidatus Euphemobacter frigidus]
MTKLDKQIIITMDGTCGSGKSTIAKRLAERLGVIYLDTGAMYRAVTWKALRALADLNNRESLIELARNTEIRLTRGEEGTRVFVDGREVTRVIRTPEVTNAVKFLADIPEVREVLVAQQRMIARLGSVVAEGRDTGSVVFPDADFKFYIDAPLEVRTARRYAEFIEKGMEITRQAVREDLEKRDHADKNRPVGALRLAEGGIVIDTGATDDIEANLQKILDCLN